MHFETSWSSSCIAANPAACWCDVLSVYQVLLLLASTALTARCVFFLLYNMLMTTEKAG